MINKSKKFREFLKKKEFTKYESDDNFWESYNKKYFAIVTKKHLILAKKISEYEYIIVEEGISPSNLNRIFKKYEVKKCLIQKNDLI